MEACDATLQDLIAADLPHNHDLAWALLEQILEGLAYVHNHGIIHRDLKPANIFLSFDEVGSAVRSVADLRGLPRAALLRLKVKLGDFGLAKDAPAERRAAMSRSKRATQTWESFVVETLRDGGSSCGEREAEAAGESERETPVVFRSGSDSSSSHAATPYTAGQHRHKGTKTDEGVCEAEDTGVNHIMLGHVTHDHLCAAANEADADAALDGANDGTTDIGTALYLPPDITGNWSDKSDMYGVGVTFFEMLFPFGTSMERLVVLRRLRSRVLQVRATKS